MSETSTNPKIKSAIKFFPFGENLYHVYDPTTLRHFKLGPEEVSWLKLLDGSRSREMLRGNIPEQYFEAFFIQLGRMDLLEGEKAKKKFDLFKIKFPLLNPNEQLNRVKNLATTYRQLLDVFFLFCLSSTVFFWCCSGDICRGRCYRSASTGQWSCSIWWRYR